MKRNNFTHWIFKKCNSSQYVYHKYFLDIHVCLYCILQPKNQGPLLLEGPGIANIPQDIKEGTDHQEPGTHRDAITAHTVRRPEIMILGMLTIIISLSRFLGLLRANIRSSSMSMPDKKIHLQTKNTFTEVVKALSDES